MSEIHVLPLLYFETEKWILSTFARHVLATITRPKSKQNNRVWYEYHAIIHTCKALTNLSPRAYRKESKLKLSLDLSGWRYLENIDSSEVREYEKKFELQVKLLFIPLKNYEGTHIFNYTHKCCEIKVNALTWSKYKTKWTLQTFQKRLQIIKTTLAHEMMHLSQSLLGVFLSLNDCSPSGKEPGNPTCGADVDGYYLLPHEFYPLLHNVKELEFQHLRRSVYGVNKLRKNRIPLLSHCKKHDSVRWRKAVKEIYKYLEI